MQKSLQTDDRFLCGKNGLEIRKENLAVRQITGPIISCSVSNRFNGKILNFIMATHRKYNRSHLVPRRNFLFVDWGIDG